jgi:hypothetical protein
VVLLYFFFTECSIKYRFSQVFPYFFSKTFLFKQVARVADTEAEHRSAVRNMSMAGAATGSSVLPKGESV